MSDDPADSLRRELEAKLPIYHISRIWPLIEAALEAARADERERLQQENQELRAEVERLRNICPCGCGNPRVEFQRGALAVSDGN